MIRQKLREQSALCWVMELLHVFERRQHWRTRRDGGSSRSRNSINASITTSQTALNCWKTFQRPLSARTASGTCQQTKIRSVSKPLNRLLFASERERLVVYSECLPRSIVSG